MASTYTSLLRLEKQGSGENDTTWGDKLNTVIDLVDAAIAGRAAVTHSDAASYTLTTANSSSDEARQMILNIAGALTAARNTVAPTSSKVYVAKNATTGGFATTLKTTAGTGIVVPNGKTTLLICDGTNVVNAIDYLDTLRVQDGNFTVVSSADHTKIGKLSASSITAGQTRTLTMPDFDGTIATLAGTEAFTNKTIGNTNTVTLKDTLFSLQDDGDATKLGSFQLSGVTAGQNRVLTWPDFNGTIATVAGTETLTNKTLTAPILNGVTTLSLDDSDSTFNLTVASTSTLTVGRTLTLDVEDGNRTLRLAGNLITAGAFSTTLTVTGDSNVTLPTAGTLATLAGTETFTNKRFTQRVVSMADGTTATPTADTADVNTHTNTQGLGTLTIANPSGTPTDGQRLLLRIKSTNAHAITWGAQYRGSVDFSLPTALSGASKWDYYGVAWHATDSKWDLIAYVQGF